MMIPGVIFSQVSPDKLMSAMDKSKWVKAGQSLYKSARKDTSSAESGYLLGLYYINPDNPAFQIDSADRYCRMSVRRYSSLSVKERERLLRVPMDSVSLSTLRRRIDSTAFERAKSIHTEEAYQLFIDHFQDARQRRPAMELRDEIAFTEALKRNTWNSFLTFLTKYPASHRAAEGRERYEKLLFDAKTSDHRLKSYIAFYHQYPQSPYRTRAERYIFELSTASGKPVDFVRFIKQYPGSRWAALGKNILMGLLRESNDQLPDFWRTDSVKHIETLNSDYWVPVYKAGLFGFINEAGEEVMQPQFTSVDEKYRCGKVVDRWLITNTGLVARNGKVLFHGEVDEALDIGSGYIEVSSDSGTFVLHESGFTVGKGPLDASDVIADRYLAIKQTGKWALYSLAGRLLIPNVYEEVSAIDTLIVLTRNGRKILTLPMKIAATAEGSNLIEDHVYDDVRRWGPQQYWVRNGVLEGVVDAQLNFIIPLDRQVLKKTSFGFLRGKDKLFVKGIPSLENDPYVSVTEQGPWVRLKKDRGLTLLYDRTTRTIDIGDSVWFQGPVAFLAKGDSIHAFLPSGLKLDFNSDENFQLREFGDRSWLIVPEKRLKAVYEATTGQKSFAMDFDVLEPVKEDVFLISRGQKKGLFNNEGKSLVPLEYDAIVKSGPSSYSLLKDRKFGWYDLETRLLTKPTFDRNIKPYNRLYRVGFRGTGYGFIMPDGKPIGSFEWDETQYWNDSVAWVRKGSQWLLWDIRNKKSRLERIRSFSPIRDLPHDKVYQVRQDNAFGVISSQSGVVVPIQYSDIVNLGTQEQPLYFTEHHIEEAAISVVIYYDHAGKIIRKQAMEASEFEKIYCDN